MHANQKVLTWREKWSFPDINSLNSEKTGTINYRVSLTPPQIPEKLPLVRREAPEEVRAKVRRGSQRKAANPVKELSHFTGPDGEFWVSKWRCHPRVIYLLQLSTAKCLAQINLLILLYRTLRLNYFCK